MSTRTRGFGRLNVSPEERKAMATKGGKQVQKDGTGFCWKKGSQEARDASQKAIEGRARARAKRLAEDAEIERSGG